MNTLDQVLTARWATPVVQERARQAALRSHLASALIALTLAVIALIFVIVSAKFLTARYVHVLAPDLSDQKNHGVLLQKEAFAQPDLLPVYGSSELVRPSLYHASQFFENYPTGFAVFPVGDRGTPPLVMVQSLAAVGADLKGKRVVISLSPEWFDSHILLLQDQYAGNFSSLQAGELAFSTELSFELKHRAAIRMLFYAETLERDPLLKFALERLADGSPLSQALYYAVLPLGKLDNLAVGIQDDVHMLVYILRQRGLSTVIAHKPASINWAALAVKAEQQYRETANNNPFGIENDWWNAFYGYLQEGKNSADDAKFMKVLQDAEGWTDLDLILRELVELGAKPLVLSMPIHGPYSDYIGVTYSARRSYYEKLRQVAKSYGVPEVDFADHDEDKYFFRDQSPHPSPKGWVYIDQALDSFYHGTLLDAPIP